MLFWPKFLTIAHGVASSVHVFLPLYLFHLLHFSYYRIAILMAIALTTRTIACGFWTAWVDQRDILLHGVLTSLLTALGAASLVLLLSIPPDTWLSWPAAILCMILDGWFFQPLGCLVDAAIIKILGDYKLLYESERRWGKLSLGITALGIGCFLDDDHDFDTLMGTVLVGCVALFLLSLSTTVQPADPLLLGLTLEEQSVETSSLLSKPPLASPHYYMDNTSHQQYYASHCNHAPPLSTHYSYKPYSLFGDHLSHISEEDASMLQRIPTTPPRASSILSANTNSMDYLLDNSTFQFTPISYCMQSPSSPTTASSPPTPSHTDPPAFTALRSSPSSSSLVPPPPSPSAPTAPISTPFSVYGIDASYSNDSPITSNANTVTSSILDTSFMSMALALLPFPPGDIPMVVLITVFPRFRPLSFYPQRRHHQHQHPLPQQQQQHLRQQHLLEQQQPHYRHHTDMVEEEEQEEEEEEEEGRSYLLIMSSCFLLGLSYAPLVLWAPLVYYDHFRLPMHTIGLMALINSLSDVMATHFVPSLMERFTLRSCVLVSHLILMTCIFFYAWIPSVQRQPWWSLLCLFTLQIASSGSIQMIWLMASYQVDLLFLSHCQERMMLRGKMSALYSSFGPAFGSLILGWLVTMEWSFQSIYLFTFLVIPLGASLTLGWC